jgi:hypothetical protein
MTDEGEADSYFAEEYRRKDPPLTTAPAITSPPWPSPDPARRKVIVACLMKCEDVKGYSDLSSLLQSALAQTEINDGSK